MARRDTPGLYIGLLFPSKLPHPSGHVRAFSTMAAVAGVPPPLLSPWLAICDLCHPSPLVSLRFLSAAARATFADSFFFLAASPERCHPLAHFPFAVGRRQSPSFMNLGHSATRKRPLISFVVSLFALPLDREELERPRCEDACPELLSLWDRDL